MFIIAVLILCSIAPNAFAQKKHSKKPSDKATIDTLNALVARHEFQFPIRTFLDDAMKASQKSHKIILAFDVDYTADEANKYVRDKLLRDPDVMIYLSKNFELALHDFSVDPSPSVGFDSLGNLGRRLDELEKGYSIVSRPTAILIKPDGEEIERIPNLENYSSAAFIQTIKDYLSGKNTVASLQKEYWNDPKNLDKHKHYMDRLMVRFDYDSIVYHLNLLATDSRYGQSPEVMKEAAGQYAYLRFKQEGNIAVLKNWVTTLDRHADSSLILAGLKDILEFYQTRKKIDSIASSYKNLFLFIGSRDPDLLNNYAWDLANFSKQWDSALVIINEAIARNEKNPNYFDTRALINYLRKDYEASVTDAKTALKYGAEDKSYFKERLEFYEKEKKRVAEEAKHPKPPTED